ncbi:hypothetical protein [Sediminibacterium goheungense]|uniref:Uncharacterized protein n=1 Tax=Sediminibacterium goheungense TaxID=1086393 RepID=A0A4R6J1V0_9BACT|nr:hypothetical protein [Sediminibacterium goheungense]TDO29232.1 hypothetical protein BC659_1315 [Sediminibacterium goheungense]
MYNILLFFTILFCTSTITAQPQSTCFEIKHLEFFDIQQTDTIQWPVSEIDQLLSTDFTKDITGIHPKTNFLIPFIVYQLKNYHPSCATQTDTVRFRKLKELYCKIRQQDVSALNSQPIITQLETIRADYDAQVQTDSLLPYMMYTIDDGPFYGTIPTTIPDYKKGSSYTTPFGTLYITKHTEKIFVTVLNTKDQHLWTRMMTVNGNRPLTELEFSGKDIFTSSLGYALRMVAEREALTLFLKADGGFRYYYHSW